MSHYLKDEFSSIQHIYVSVGKIVSNYFKKLIKQDEDANLFGENNSTYTDYVVTVS
jgi:hypothetical protein